MHRSRAARTLAILTLGVALADGLAAKAPTTRLVISGQTLARPLETSEPKTLANVWAGRFIGEPSTEPDSRLPRYRITFYVVPPREQERPMYVVTFARDPESGQAYVYLPGRGEDGYRMNVRTMLREGQDGRWHHAGSEWSDAIARILARPN